MYQTFCKVFQSFEREPVTYVLSSLLKTLLVSVVPDVHFHAGAVDGLPPLPHQVVGQDLREEEQVCVSF